MYSMTGYGKGTAEREGKTVVIELKSVNHRFLDVSIKMPRAFNCLEDRVRSILKERLARGRVEVFVNVTDAAGESLAVELNKAAVSGYIGFAKQIASEFYITNDITVSDIFGMKDVFIDTEVTPDTELIWSLMREALNVAVDSLLAMRRTEGDKIKANILQKLDNMLVSVRAIEEYAPQQIENYKAKLADRVREALGEVPIDESRLLNEVIFYADKVAVDEEFTRLYAHIDHFREIMESEQAAGRSLDFIVQEMNREANTIGSKCSDLSVSNHVLLLKTDIEKLREQIQNIE